MELATQLPLLSPSESIERKRHERVIEAGRQTFIDVGNALIAIRDGHLHRSTHKTFAEYCEDRWGFTYHRAYELIQGAQVANNLKTLSKDNVLPINETQVRPLTSLSPSNQQVAWQKAVQNAPNGKPTAAQVAKEAAPYKAPVTKRVDVDDFDGFYDDVPVRQVDEDTGEVFDDEPISEPDPISVPVTPPNNAYKNSSESNEWYTPQHLIDRARAVLGYIDLDPASSIVANQTVQAKRIYSITDNGLLKPWEGRIWCNPPYGDEVGKFAEKMVTEYENGRIIEGLLLVASRTDTQWFRKLRRYPRCFLWGRVKFIKSDTGEEKDPAGFPSMVVYFGSHPDNFASVFQPVGDVYDWVGAK